MVGQVFVPGVCVCYVRVKCYYGGADVCVYIEGFGDDIHEC